MTAFYTPEDLTGLVTDIFRRHGFSAANATIVARVVVAAERDGTHSHGLLRMPGYIGSIKSGWVDGKAVPVVDDAAPGLVVVDARNGFAQVALAATAGLLRAKARQQGIAALAIRDSHHFGSLWPDVEPFAEDGFVALSYLNSRSRMVPWGGKRKILGTNPIAFACPRAGKPPMVFDQAASVMSQGDVVLAAKEGRSLPPGVGVDAAGEDTTDPKAVLNGGALLPFGKHKGHNIALMVEVLAAGLTGGRFGIEDTSINFPGAETSNAGQFVILIDPGRNAAATFAERIEILFERLESDDSARLPGDRRAAHRAAAMAQGIAISDQTYQALCRLRDEAPPPP